MDSNTVAGSHAGATPSPIGDERYTRSTFIPESCLFCNKQLEDTDANRSHMQTVHGLFIPSRDRLLVDLDTLFDYLHLVIFGYNECISCGIQRNTPLAAQQHMMGKNHCRFDIAGEGSEFADFYDFSEAEDDDGEDNAGDGVTVSESTAMKQATWIDDNSLRLPSGKIISSRPDSLAGLSRQKKTIAQWNQISSRLKISQQQPPDTATSLAECSDSPRTKALTKSEKRETAFRTQLANMRVGDRQALAHLPLPQQRSEIATSLKQLKKARQLERRHQISTERSGNKTLMKHYVADGPARPNG
ncbi:uncharacterized protein PG998_001545 [Apiospora kogelbergensis]|uniref:uncharacterized protein n=1 Tax=Apiospora kogelbergensis TaxID=1337665 RepID=UPI0031301C7E